MVWRKYGKDYRGTIFDTSTQYNGLQWGRCWSGGDDGEKDPSLPQLTFASVPYINQNNQNAYTLEGGCLSDELYISYSIEQVAIPPGSTPLKQSGTVICQEKTWELYPPINLSALPDGAQVEISISITGFKSTVPVVKDVSLIDAALTSRKRFRRLIRRHLPLREPVGKMGRSA